MKVLGLELERGPYTKRRTVIGTVAATATGNVCLRIGREDVNGAGATTGWTQTEYLVLDPDEARTLAAELLAALGES